MRNNWISSTKKLVRTSATTFHLEKTDFGERITNPFTDFHFIRRKKNDPKLVTLMYSGISLDHKWLAFPPFQRIPFFPSLQVSNNS